MKNPGWEMAANGVRREKAALSRSYGATGAVPLRFRR